MSYKPRHSILASLFALAVSAGGCLDLGERTPGELGQGEFSYSTGTGCFFGCGLDRPLMTTTEERISVHAEILPALSVDSEDPQVVRVLESERTVACCDTASSGSHCTFGVAPDACGAESRTYFWFSVRAEGPGEARVQLLDPSGGLFDALAMTVRDPQGFMIEARPVDTEDELQTVEDTLIMSTAKAYEIAATPFDANAHSLHASRGVSMTIEDPTVAVFGNGDRDTEGAFVRVVPRRPGETQLRIVSRSAETHITLRVASEP